MPNGSCQVTAPSSVGRLALVDSSVSGELDEWAEHQTTLTQSRDERTLVRRVQTLLAYRLGATQETLDVADDNEEISLRTNVLG